MKKITILLAVLLLVSNNLFSQKKTKPTAKPNPVAVKTTPVQMDFDKKFYGMVGVNQVGDEYLGNSVNVLVGLEKQVSRYIILGAGINYSSYPALVDDMRSRIVEILEADGIGTYKLKLDIEEFDVSCFEVEGQMKIKFTRARDGIYGRLGFAAMFLSQDKHTVFLDTYYSEPETIIMKKKSELLIAYSLGVGYEYDITNQVGLWLELKFTPSLAKSEISDIQLFQSNFGLGVYYRY